MVDTPASFQVQVYRLARLVLRKICLNSTEQKEHFGFLIKWRVLPVNAMMTIFHSCAKQEPLLFLWEGDFTKLPFLCTPAKM